MAELNARIIAKASATAAEEPLAGDLEVAELAVNTADGKLFTKHIDGSIVTISGGGGSGAVDSVNSQTGVVSLGIQDMDDYSLVINKDAHDYFFDTFTTGTPATGGWGTGSLKWDATDADGTAYTNGTGTKTFWASPDGFIWTQATENIQFSGSSFYYVQFSDLETQIDNEGWVNLYLAFTEPVNTSAALADEDLLRWNAADSKFKPTSDYISLTSLKAEVAASTDFADFQSRIAAL